MIKIILPLAIIFVGCNHKNKFTTVSTKCVVDSVYEVQRSTIEFDKRYTLVTDCGEYPITTNNLRIKKGDTLVFSKIVKAKK
jgi:hypothetical protein